MRVEMYFETGELCAYADVSSMEEASEEAIAMAAQGHCASLRQNGAITHHWKGRWAPVQ